MGKLQGYCSSSNTAILPPVIVVCFFVFCALVVAIRLIFGLKLPSRLTPCLFLSRGHLISRMRFQFSVLLERSRLNYHLCHLLFVLLVINLSLGAFFWQSYATPYSLLGHDVLQTGRLSLSRYLRDVALRGFWYLLPKNFYVFLLCIC